MATVPRSRCGWFGSPFAAQPVSLKQPRLFQLLEPLTQAVPTFGVTIWKIASGSAGHACPVSSGGLHTSTIMIVWPGDGMTLIHWLSMK